MTPLQLYRLYKRSTDGCLWRDTAGIHYASSEEYPVRHIGKLRWYRYKVKGQENILKEWKDIGEKYA
jgi:hypothetical protein